jgi:hypothetical protein
MAAAKTFAFGGFTPLRVPAGTYKVVIRKGNDTFTNDLVVEYDKKSEIPLADRKMQEQTARKLYDMCQELAYFVYKIDEHLKAAEALKVKNPQAAKGFTAFVNELTKLKKTLVVTEGDNYVGAAEPQLREKLAELYSRVAQSFYKPNKAEIDNMEALTQRFDNAKSEYDRIKGKYKKFDETLVKNGLNTVSLKPFDEFVREP